MTKNYAFHFTKHELIANQAEALLNWSERWPNFRPMELASKGDGALLVNYQALDTLQRMRNSWKRPMVVTSAYRDPKYNERVRGAADSLHMQGRAFDISIERFSDAHIVSFIYHAVRAGFTGFGLYKTFMHLDTGTPRTWQQGEDGLGDRCDVNEFC